FVGARALLTAISVTLLVTACGGGGDSAATGQQTTPPPSGGSPGSTNQAPTISGNPPTTATVGVPYSFTPTASDPDKDTLTFSVSNKPAWMSINTATGQLTGTPTATGSFPNITITVSDGKGGTASLTAFNVAVSSAATGSLAVTLNWDAPTANSDGTALTDLKSYRILYGQDASNLNQSKLIPSTVNSAVIDNLSSGTWYFAIVSVNAAGAESAPSNVASAAI
ncbi:MAG TPA: putative Ig domain-containing protein, partial [Steroidobacteraceae bacterium]|nr:putative Ig domain-containing protein [Steroidobacteraceae bacterium]